MLTQGTVAPWPNHQEQGWHSGESTRLHFCDQVWFQWLARGLSLLLVLSLLQGFSQSSPVPPSIKTNISKFELNLNVKCLHMSSWLGRLGDYSLHHDVKFDLPFFFTMDLFGLKIVGAAYLQGLVQTVEATHREALFVTGVRKPLMNIATQSGHF